MGNSSSFVYWNENSVSCSAKVNSRGKVVSEVRVHLKNYNYPKGKLVERRGKLYLDINF